MRACPVTQGVAPYGRLQLGDELSLLRRSRTVCHNGQSAALLSSSGLVMYFSTLLAPSSSAPCILTILTHLRVCVKICILTHPLRLKPRCSLFAARMYPRYKNVYLYRLSDGVRMGLFGTPALYFLRSFMIMRHIAHNFAA